MWEFIHCVHMWFSGVCHLYTSLSGEVKSLLDTGFSNCFQNSVDFETLKLHSPQPVFGIFLASSKQAPFSEAEIFLLLLCRHEWCSLLTFTDWLPQTELTVFFLLGTQQLLCTEGFCWFVFWCLFFYFSDFLHQWWWKWMQCSSMYKQDFIHLCSYLGSLTVVDMYTRLWWSQWTTVPLWWVLNAIVTQNLHDKGIKDIFSADFQMIEGQVSIKGVMTHAQFAKLPPIIGRNSFLFAPFRWFPGEIRGQTGHHRI